MIISKDVFNAMIKSQLSYCPLISILPSRKSNNLIKQRSLNTVKASLNWSNSSFELCCKIIKLSQSTRETHKF